MSSVWIIGKSSYPEQPYQCLVIRDLDKYIECACHNTEQAQNIINLLELQSQTFYRLIKDDMQAAAKQAIGRLLTPEELKEACEAGGSMELPWMDYLEGVIEGCGFDDAVRCMHCKRPEDMTCSEDRQADCDKMCCKYCEKFGGGSKK